MKPYPEPSLKAVRIDGKEVLAPEIGFDAERAYYPLRMNEEGKILPSFQSRVCVKKIIFVCREWEAKRVYFPFDWFLLNDFVLMKRPRIEPP